MGITIRSKNMSIDLGYFGFARLRKKIAFLLCEEMGKHYEELFQAHVFQTQEEEKAYWKKYDATTELIANKYCSPSTWKVINFLYEPDTGSQVTYGTCKQILKVLGDYDDNIIYGYAGRPDGAKIRNFKELLQDCVSNRCAMKWQ